LHREGRERGRENTPSWDSTFLRMEVKEALSGGKKEEKKPEPPSKTRCGRREFGPTEVKGWGKEEAIQSP